MAGIPALSGVALVTGAASGIGKETGHTFAEAGCTVVIYADLNLEEAQTAAEESRAFAANKDYRCLALHVDVMDADSVQQMVDIAMKEFGRIDYSVNAAGIGNTTVRPTGKTNLDELNNILDTNLKGTAYCVRAVAKVMMAQEPLQRGLTSRRAQVEASSHTSCRGVIVNLGSANSFMTQWGTLAYTAAKHGVMGVTKAAALDHAKDGIRVNAVCPGPVDTPIMQRAIARTPAMAQMIEKAVPLHGRMATVAEVASAVAFLCSPGASYITGTGLMVDAGVTLTTARL